MDINKNIRSIRIEKGLKQQVIASALNWDISIVSNLELGKREVKVNELEKIANALGVTVVDLLTWPVKYVPVHSVSDKVRATLQIELTSEKKAQVLKLVLGEETAKILDL